MWQKRTKWRLQGVWGLWLLYEREPMLSSNEAGLVLSRRHLGHLSRFQCKACWTPNFKMWAVNQLLTRHRSYTTSVSVQLQANPELHHRITNWIDSLFSLCWSCFRLLYEACAWNWSWSSKLLHSSFCDSYSHILLMRIVDCLPASFCFLWFRLLRESSWKI